MKTAIVNLGDIISGDWRDPHAHGDTIITDGGRIVSVGTASAAAVESADVVIDADACGWDVLHQGSTIAGRIAEQISRTL